MSDWLKNFPGSLLLTTDNLLLGFFVFVVTFVLSLAVVGFIVTRLPVDYFHPSYKRTFMDGQHRVLRGLAFALKNILGFLLVLLGIVLSLPGVPGQGLITILIGVMLLDFPGKRELERKIINRPAVLSTVNKLRVKFSRPPLQL
ncbi:MAG: hypothetical protein RL020_1274 [Pseudomonadota bacterium]|jgi:archaellum biogenesis protein FlaJ (TadC family)